jgi:uncharacterized membrane protein
LNWWPPPSSSWAAISCFPPGRCGALTANPTGIGGGHVLGRDDPAPGIFKITRHPVMWAVTLWASVHVLNAADAAALIFFGALGIPALGGVAHMDARRNRDGGQGWQRLVACTSFIPFVAAAQGRTRISLAEIGWARMAFGVVIYGVLLFGHQRVIGVVVTPW